MALKTFKPYTKSTRGTILTSRAGLWKGKPYKPLTSANYSSKGRNNYGRITSRPSFNWFFIRIVFNFFNFFN